jgi:hypothetical protein
MNIQKNGFEITTLPMSSMEFLRFFLRVGEIINIKAKYKKI